MDDFKDTQPGRLTKSCQCAGSFSLLLSLLRCSWHRRYSWRYLSFSMLISQDHWLSIFPFPSKSCFMCPIWPQFPTQASILSFIVLLEAASEMRCANWWQNVFQSRQRIIKRLLQCFEPLWCPTLLELQLILKRPRCPFSLWMKQHFAPTINNFYRKDIHSKDMFPEFLYSDLIVV